MSLGEKIVMLRKARGMNQEQLAAALGVSRQAVSKWELNEAVPDVTRVVAISELFGVTTDYLLKANSDNPAAFEAKNDAGPPECDSRQKDQKLLGVTLTAVSAVGLLATWAVEELRGVSYYTDYIYHGSGFFGRIFFSGGFALFVLLLCAILIGGIRLLMGKPFLPAIFTVSFWQDQYADDDGETYSQATREFLKDHTEDTE